MHVELRLLCDVLMFKSAQCVCVTILGAAQNAWRQKVEGEAQTGGRTSQMTQSKWLIFIKYVTLNKGEQHKLALSHV